MRSVLDILMEMGAVRPDDRAEAERESPHAPEQYLLNKGRITELQLARARAQKWGIPFVRIDDGVTVERELPQELVRTMRVCGVSANGHRVIAVTDPDDVELVDLIYRLVGREVELAVATPSDIQAALIRSEAPPVEISPAEEAQEAGLSLEQLLDIAKAEPAVRFVNMILSRGLQMGASDVHLEAVEKGGVVRYRVDGVLSAGEGVPKTLYAGAVSRIKILAGLDIAEQRVPQDGQFQVRFAGRVVDVRTNTLPSIHGEGVVMRLLDREGGQADISRLGLDPADEEILRKAAFSPHGIILVTGPTGSGKSTTLAAVLRMVSRPEVKILTVEDPVEYHIPGAVQVQVNPKAGLTFAAALRAFLRHDPDVIEVGEIRDAETAQIATRAALTGHLVLSTLHTNSAVGAIPRLIDMGVEPYLLADALILVEAQRLVRRVCTSCARQVAVPQSLRAALPDAPEFQMAGAGCAQCGGKGYRGRTGIYELVPVTDEIRELIVAKAPVERIAEAAKGMGRPTMVEDGLRKVRAGITTVEEILRVTRE